MARDAARSVAAAKVGARWTPAEAAEFAALREFRLLQLLSKDRRALAVAKHVGLFAAGSRNQAAKVQQPSSVSSMPKRRAAQTQTCDSAGGDAALNATQRRSNARAAKHVPRHLRQQHDMLGGDNPTQPQPETSGDEEDDKAFEDADEEPAIEQTHRQLAPPSAPPLPPQETNGGIDVQMAGDGHGEAPASPRCSGMAWREQVVLRAASETLAARATGGFASRPRGAPSPYDRRPTEPWPWRAKGKGKGRGRGEGGGGGRGGARPSPR